MSSEPQRGALVLEPSLAGWALGLALLATCCSTSGQQQHGPVATDSCPHFTGEYAYPGIAEINRLCAHRSSWDELSFPADGGFIPVARAAHTIEIRQDRCRSLTISFRVDDSRPQASPPDFPHQVTLPLVLHGKRQRVEWSQDGLFWRRRFYDTGPRFIPIWSFDYQEMELQLVPEGLRYKLRQKSGSGFHEKLVAEMECILPRVQP